MKDCGGGLKIYLTNMKSTTEKKLVKFLRGTSLVLKTLAKEIEKEGLTKDKEDLLANVGSRLLFEAKAFGFRN